MTQDKTSYARRRNEAYRGTSIDNNAVYEVLDESKLQVILGTVPKELILIGV